MNRWISIAALCTLFFPLMIAMMDLFAYRCVVVHPLLIAQDPNKVPGRTLVAFWDVAQIWKEYKFLKELTNDSSAQAAVSSLHRRFMLILGLAVPTVIFLVLNLFQ